MLRSWQACLIIFEGNGGLGPALVTRAHGLWLFAANGSWPDLRAGVAPTLRQIWHGPLGLGPQLAVNPSSTAPYYVKLDGPATMATKGDQAAMEWIQKLVSLARSLDATVFAQAIENAEDLAQPAKTHDAGQGFQIAKPELR